MESFTEPADINTTASAPSQHIQATSEEEDNSRMQQWEEFGHEFEAGELEALKRSVADMALSRIEGQDDLYVGG